MKEPPILVGINILQSSMENSEEDNQKKMYKLLRERRLAKNKMPIEDLTRLIHWLVKYKKKECAEMVDMLMIVLNRKKELLHEDIGYFFRMVYWYWILYN